MAAERDADGFVLPVLSTDPHSAAARKQSSGAGGAVMPTALVEKTLRKLYLVSALHGFSDACAKLSTPGFVMEMFGTDFVAASAFFAMVNSGQVRFLPRFCSLFL